MNDRTPLARRMALLAVVALTTSLPSAAAWLGEPVADAAIPLAEAAPAQAIPPGPVPSILVQNASMGESIRVQLWTADAAPLAAQPLVAAPILTRVHLGESGHQNVTFAVAEMERGEDGSWRYTFAPAAGDALVASWSVVLAVDEE